MKHFNYKARDGKGALVKGEQIAENRDDVADILITKGLMPVKITLLDTKKSFLSINLNTKVSPEHLAVFTKQMYSLLRAGIPTIRAIYGIAETTQSEILKDALLDIAKNLEKGQNLSTCLTTHSKIFNKLFVSIVSVGEQTGRTDTAFQQLTEYIEKENETKRMIKTALRYPVFVIGAILVAMAIMNIFVIPTFNTIFAKMGADLPMTTRILITTSDFFVNFWPLIIVICVLTVYGFLHWTQTEQGELTWGRVKLELPIVGSIVKQASLARFSRTLSVMLSGGVPLTNALSLTGEAVDNAFMKSKLQEIRSGVEKGASLKKMSYESGMFTPLILQMITVGEETGNMDSLLLEISEYYEREVSYEVGSLSSKIEPIMLGVVAGMVLILALGIFSPMWDMLGHMTKDT